MKKVKVLLLAILTLSGVLTSTFSFAEKTNFSYSTLGLNFGTTTYKTPICAAGQCLSDFSTTSLGGSLQFADDWLVLSLSGASLKGSGPVWSATVGGGVFGLSLVKAIADKIDVQAGIASLSNKVEVCAGVTCVSTTDTGTGYSASMNIWLDDSKKIASNLTFVSSKFTKATTSTNTYGIGLGYYVTEHDEIHGADSTLKCNFCKRI